MESGKTIVKMKACMRWYGPQDAVSLPAIRQAGVQGIVTALHQIPVGEVWSVAAIRKRQAEIRRHGLEWEVVESLPVHEAIKQGKPNIGSLIENYKESLRNLGACGIPVVTYNFMPVLDWVRTDLRYRNPDTSLTLRFDRVAFAYFDLYLLKRPGAQSDYSPSVLEAAKALSTSLSTDQVENLRRAVLQGLPGSDEHFTEAGLLQLLEQYDHISESNLREHLITFLKEVVPVAVEAGVALAIHPDDPPYPLLGLPRVVSTAADLGALFRAVPEIENGLCFCTGALGAGPDNELLDIFDSFKERVHFLHLRNILHEKEGVFRESPHLEGHVPMEDVVMAILRHMQQLGKGLAMRPDHGVLHEMELASGAFPGYSLIGRLKGLAELKGLELGLIARS